MSFDLTAIEQMKAYAEFGKAVIELAKEQDIIPKRERVVVRTRNPRRTKVQIVQDRVEAEAKALGAKSVGVSVKG